MSRSSVALVRAPRQPLGEGPSQTDETAPRVLIVEDERIVAADLQRLLRKLGYDAYAHAASASRALALAAQTPPDLVLADIRIEGPVDGIDTAYQLHRQYGSAVIFLSAHADDPTLERAKHADPCGYLIKPVTAPAVKSAIELALHRREQKASERAIEWALAQTSADLLSALNHLPLAIQLEDFQGRVLHVNPAFRLLFGIEEERLDLAGIHGTTLLAYVQSLCEQAERFGIIADCLRRSQQTLIGDVITLRDGRKLEIGYIPVFQGSHRQGQVWIYRDITSGERALEELEESAARARRETLVDALTGLTSRPGFFQLAGTYLKLARCSGSHKRILFFIDVDGLKAINDQYGHAAGDGAICAVARALRATFRPADLIARMGGDEFVVLCMMTPHDIESVRSRLVAQLNQHNGGAPHPLDVSLGMAEHVPEESFEALIGRADRAMYSEKRAKRT